MPALSVSSYDQEEALAILSITNRIVEIFQPITFQQYGYPNRIHQEMELFKYIDTMHDHEFESSFAAKLLGLTEYEFDLIKNIASMVNTFSKTRFSTNVIPQNSLMGSLNTLRHIKYIYGEAKPTIFEVGPGSGYLGAMLIVDRYPYIATEVTQAFYLYQNHLWNYITGDKILELANPDCSLNDLNLSVPHEPMHIPWWEFSRIKPNTIPNFDVIVCNRVLVEMHMKSLEFLLKIAREVMSGHGKTKVFILDGWGGGAIGSPVYKVTQLFYEYGFGIVHCDPLITVFASRDSDCGKNYLPLPNRTNKRVIGRLVRNFFRRYLVGIPLLPFEILYTPLNFATEHNPVSKTITEHRKIQNNLNTIDLSAVKSFYTALIGADHYYTQDELFDMWPKSN